MNLQNNILITIIAEDIRIPSNKINICFFYTKKLAF